MYNTRDEGYEERSKRQKFISDAQKKYGNCSDVTYAAAHYYDNENVKEIYKTFEEYVTLTNVTIPFSPENSVLLLNQMRESQEAHLHDNIKEIYKLIHDNEKNDKSRQLNLFANMPTELIRMCPFSPMAKAEKRQYKERSEDYVFGKITIKGVDLSILDEDVLLAVLALQRQRKYPQGIVTTRYALCRILKLTPTGNNYINISESLDRLTGTKIRIDVLKPTKEANNKGKKQKYAITMNGSILSATFENHETGKIVIKINDYFTMMYEQSFISYINLDDRLNLRGDIAKALYRFLCSQPNDKPMTYPIDFLIKSLNLNEDLPFRKIRERLKIAATELKKKGNLSSFTLKARSNQMTFQKAIKTKTKVLSPGV